MKTLCALFALLLALTLVQCTDNSVIPGQDEFVSKGPGGGGHTETTGNNLSFPVLSTDGNIITPLANPTFLVAYNGPYTGLTSEDLAKLGEDTWYAQKVEGNVWQAEFNNIPQGQDVGVTFVDWGDAIESVDPKINRPYRLELALYNKLVEPMDAYRMELLAFPSSPNETQGTNNTLYESDYATITSAQGRLIVQKYNDGAVLTWNGTQWTGEGVENPIQITFAPELNVGGKYIFGASRGGWTPSEIGNYRITFYMEGESSVNISGAFIADNAFPETPKIAENNQAMVDVVNNLTYVDVQATAGGGGGGGH